MSTSSFSLMRSFRAAARDVVEMLRGGDRFSRYYVYGVTGLFTVLFGVMGILTPATTAAGKVFLIVSGFVLTPTVMFAVGTVGYCLIEALTDWGVEHYPVVRATKRKLRKQLQTYRDLRSRGLALSEVAAWEDALGSALRIGAEGPRSVRRLQRRCDRMHSELKTMLDAYWLSDRSFSDALEDAYRRTRATRLLTKEIDCVWLLRRPVEDVAVRRLVDAYTPPQSHRYPRLLCTPLAIHDLIDRVVRITPVKPPIPPARRIPGKTLEATVSSAVLLRGADPDIVWTLFHDDAPPGAPTEHLVEAVETARLL